MSTKITIDSAGRVVIPKPFRKSLGLQAGDSLEIDATADEITLRPVREAATLIKEQGIWVYRPDVTITNEDVSELLDQLRDERTKDFLG
jgi:AbrB family looped-hinge helix DNA binding protein